MEALGDIAQAVGSGCVVVAHGGVTVDVLRSVVGYALLAPGDPPHRLELRDADVDAGLAMSIEEGMRMVLAQIDDVLAVTPL